MEIMTIEGVVEQGRIRLPAHIRLPEKTRVYVVVPGLQVERGVHVSSPHLAHPEEAAEFVLQVVENPNNATV